jgi:hypothetical protein
MSVPLIIAASLLAGLLHPYLSRRQATGLWAGRALVPSGLDAVEKVPRNGLQSAINGGWQAWACFAISILLPVATLVAAVVFGGLAGFALVLTFWSFGAVIVGPIFTPRDVEYYLHVYISNLTGRAERFVKAGDKMRAEAAQELAAALVELRSMYHETGIPAPSMREAAAVPFGETRLSRG